MLISYNNMLNYFHFASLLTPPRPLKIEPYPSKISSKI